MPLWSHLTDIEAHNSEKYRQKIGLNGLYRQAISPAITGVNAECATDKVAVLRLYQAAKLHKCNYLLESSGPSFEVNDC
jgi:hypothetical protein